MTPQEFIDKLKSAAQECHRKHGVPASFTLAQGALESGWGKSQLANSGCNLFGVKADASWHGAVTVIQTREWFKGQWVVVPAKWRCYQNWLECLEDHAEFFKSNPRYKACFKETTGEGWAHAVASAGYATDPDYAAKVIAVIHSHNLSQYDNQTEGGV